MSDMIEGCVYKVIDGDTFDIKITYTGDNNDYEYEDVERIRIAEIDAPELDTRLGNRAREDLERMILGKRVRCFVQSRDMFNRVIAKVKLV